jgi:uncharacterized integral membrane protein
MQFVRTFVWMLVSAVLVAFVAMNWTRAPVNLWPLDAGYLHLDWPVGVIALVFFLLGLVPMWIFSQAGRWRLRRRIATLEDTIRTSAVSLSAPLPEASQPYAGDIDPVT